MNWQVKHSVQAKLPAEARELGKERIARRRASEIPTQMDLSTKNALTLFGVGGLIALVWNISGAPTNFMYWLIQLGVPGVAFWFNNASAAHADRFEREHSAQIEHEEWTAALRSHGHTDEYPS